MLTYSTYPYTNGCERAEQDGGVEMKVLDGDSCVARQS